MNNPDKANKTFHPRRPLPPLPNSFYDQPENPFDPRYIGQAVITSEQALKLDPQDSTLSVERAKKVIIELSDMIENYVRLSQTADSEEVRTDTFDKLCTHFSRHSAVLQFTHGRPPSQDDIHPGVSLADVSGLIVYVDEERYKTPTWENIQLLIALEATVMVVGDLDREFYRNEGYHAEVKTFLGTLRMPNGVHIFQLLYKAIQVAFSYKTS